MPEEISAEPGSSSGTKEDLIHEYRQIRSFSEQLAVRVTPEDMQLQSMPDASPAKWYLANTTWCFENFLQAWRTPLYWLQRDDDRDVFTLAVRGQLQLEEPAKTLARWQFSRIRLARSS